MIDLYVCGSPNVLKVMLMLEETELLYDLHKINVHAAEQFRPEFLALNPHNKVPVLIDKDGPEGCSHTVFESAAILFYLAEKTGRFFGATLTQRSEVMQWLMVQMSAIGPMFGQALHFQYIAPQACDYSRRRYLSEVKRLYDLIETRLGQSEWLGGQEYSIADIATWPWAAKYYNYTGFQIPLVEFPNLSRWIKAIDERPAYRRIHDTFKALFKEGLQQQCEANPDDVDRFFGRGRYLRS